MPRSVGGVSDDWALDPRPVRRVRARSEGGRAPDHGRVEGRPDDGPGDAAGDEGSAPDWAHAIPAVRQLLENGLDLAPGVNLLVGDNGAGKSTIVEAVAMAFGLAAEGGSRSSQHRSRTSESALWQDLHLERTPGAPKWGFFLRAETMHGFYTYLETEAPGPDPQFHEMSHGESFLEVLRTRFTSPGFYCLDEPEAALSFTSQLALIATLVDLAEAGGQVLCATHSPLLAAVPNATIWEVGEWGLRPTQFEDLTLVLQWRAFLNDPQQFLRRVL